MSLGERLIHHMKATDFRENDVYLIRPDQHVAARFDSYDETKIRAALRRTIGKE